MANLASMVTQKNENDQQWREQRQMERENASAMQDALVTEITTLPDLYGLYLQMQGDNPAYSPGNVAMVIGQSSDPGKFATAEKWRSMGRSIAPGEKDKGMNIFARSSFNRGYTLTPVYDIKQTYGRPLQEVALTDGTDKMTKALQTLLNYSVVPLSLNENLPVPARYDEVGMKIEINPNTPDSEAFAAIATEVALSRFRGKGNVVPVFDRKEFELDAESVSYILCRRFGIKRELPDAKNVGKLYEGMDASQRRGALSSIQDMCKQIGGTIEKNITPPQKARTSARGAI